MPATRPFLIAAQCGSRAQLNHWRSASADWWLELVDYETYELILNFLAPALTQAIQRLSGSSSVPCSAICNTHGQFDSICFSMEE